MAALVEEIGIVLVLAVECKVANVVRSVVLITESQRERCGRKAKTRTSR